MQVMSISAVTITSPQPERLAEFYRATLGIALERAAHGPMQQHFEGWLGEPTRGGVHFAVLKGRGPADGAGGTAATFRVRDIHACVDELMRAGVPRVHAIADLGDGKRVASFRDPDGNVFRLIDLGY